MRRHPQTQVAADRGRRVKRRKQTFQSTSGAADDPSSHDAPPQGRFTAPEASRLLEVVLASSLFYPNCATASVGALPEHLPNTFTDAWHYTQTFLPLLREEARETIKASFSDSLEQEIFWDACLVNVEQQGNGWVKVEAALKRFCGKGNAPRLFQNAVVVLTNVRPRKKDPLEHLLKLLKKQKGAAEKVNRVGEKLPPATAMATAFVQFDPDRSVMTLRGKPICEPHQSDPNAPCRLTVLEHLRQFPESWLVVPAGGLVTQQRECDILHALNKIPIMDAILKPDQHLNIDMDEMPRKSVTELDDGIREFVGQTYDQSQLEAMMMCAAQFGLESSASGVKAVPIMMIQGPPGTGKTHTVQGILNLWHLMQFELYYQRVISQYRDADAVRMEKTELAAIRSAMKPRILVCAPSNAAVDELLERTLAHGFRDSTGRIYKPHIVRIGAEDVAYSDEVRMVLLDGIVNGYMRKTRREWDGLQAKHQSAIQALENELTELKRMLVHKEQTIDDLGSHLLSKMEKLERAETELERLRLVEDVVDGTCTNERAVREALEVNFLDHAEMVFTTLSSTGRRVLSKVNRGFETVLIDEAAQASEVAALQPLVYGCQQCVLVGDPQQLPATIISQRGKQLNMERSLFARLKEAGAPVKLLSVQYRMHPWIREFPSGYFYEHALQDGLNVQQRRPEPFYNHDLLKPYVVFDVSTGVHERKKGGSLQNQVEADLAVALFKELRDFLIEAQQKAQMNGLPAPGAVRVGVLTPYRSQTRCLVETFMRLLGPAITSEVKIQTVDSCQGKQLDVVIFSCVRASSAKGSGVGFIADVRRMNVAVTRAKKALWILGNFRTLVSHPAWAALEKDAKERGCFIVESTAQSLFPEQGLFDGPHEVPSEETAPDQPPLDTEAELETAQVKDPRLGIVQPLVEDQTLMENEMEGKMEGVEDCKSEDVMPQVKEETMAAAEVSNAEADGRCSDEVVAEAMESNHEEQVAAIQQLDSNLNSVSLAETEVEAPAVSTAAVSPPVSPWMPSFMVVELTGPPTQIGPPLASDQPFLVMNGPSGAVAMPLTVRYHGVQGVQPQLLQAGVQQNNHSDALEVFRRWLENQ